MSKKKLDLTNVETYTKMSEGIHKVKVTSCEDKTSQGGDDMLVIAFEAISGEDKGSKVYDNFVLTEKALWKVKQLLQALGIKCDGKIVLDTDKLIGKKCEVEVYHEEYNGQLRARVNEYRKATAAKSDDDDEYDDDDADEDDDDVEEEKPAKKAEPKTKKSGSKKKPEPEEDDDEWEDEEEEEKPAKKPAKKAAKSNKKSKPEPDEDDEDDDDEDWEEA